VSLKMPGHRIVSLAPSNTEILQALGLLDQLVGVDDWTDWPPEAAALPRVGPDLSIDLDRVVALEPTLVLASLSVPGMERNVEGLQARGLPFIALDPQRIADIWANIRWVAAAAGVPERAEPVIAQLQERLEAVRQRAPRHRPRLYFEWWPKPIYTPGAGNWLSEAAAIAGGVNIFDDYPVANVKVTDPEEVLRRSPDLVLLAYTGARQPRAAVPLRRPGWDRFRGRVYILEEALFNRPSPRLVDGIERLGQILRGEEAPAG
jgi:iron complex transport system substrate-binding protein